MSEEEKEVLSNLENNIPYDYCRSCDSEDGLYHEWIDEDSWQYKVKMLLKEKGKEIEELDNRIGHALGYIEGAYKVDINYVCKILKGVDKE